MPVMLHDRNRERLDLTRPCTPPAERLPRYMHRPDAVTHTGVGEGHGSTSGLGSSQPPATTTSATITPHTWIVSRFNTAGRAYRNP